MTQHDENLHYNIARAYFAKADIDKTVHHLLAALAVNKNLEVAQKFLVYLKKNNLLPARPAEAAPAEDG